MRTWVFIIAGLLISVLLKAEIRDNNALLLKDLDSAIKERKFYNEGKEKYINIRKEKLGSDISDDERFGIYSQLYEAYIAYQTDSALKFVNEQSKMLKTLTGDEYLLEVQLNKAGATISAGMYKESSEILSVIPRNKLSGDLLIKYFQRYRTLYGHIADYTVADEDKVIYNQYADNYRDSLLLILPEDCVEYLIIKADQLNTHEKADESIILIKNFTDTCSNAGIMRFLAYTLSVSYKKKGDADMREHYLIKSAIADIQYSVREYASLKELSFLLYEKGDLDRAYDYMKCSMEDALACNARTRTIENAKIFPVIDGAYQLKNERRQRIVSILFFAMSFLSLCLIGAIIYVYVQMKKLAAARKVLSETNDRLNLLNNTLSETNIIKEEYIAQYASRCSVYIDKMDRYRKRLAKFVSTGKMEDLVKEIKSEDLIENERREFYKEFDRTFLGIFPNFVRSFNSLLNEKDRIYPKSGDLLNTELRIFALIRLGITDSTKIADFLQYSITTIYNYRSKIRNKAICDKNDFENIIATIK
jgi:hypothetical protein